MINNKKNKVRGFVCVIITAIIFGFTPILGKISYEGGSNPIMLTFLRTLLIIPIVYFILLSRKVKIIKSKKITRQLIIYSILISVLTTTFLYTAYTYIPVGLSTIIHYVYPLVVMLLCVFVYKEKINRIKVVALILALIGVWISFSGTASCSIKGVLIALLSGVFYGVGLVYYDKSDIKNEDVLLVTFYVCIITSIILFFYAMATGTFTLQLSREAWIYSVAVSISVGLIAFTSLQIGIKYIGSTASSIILTIEPLSCAIFAVIFLNEPLTFATIMSSIFILSSVILLSFYRD